MAEETLEQHLGCSFPGSLELDDVNVVEMLDADMIKSLIPERGTALFVDRAVVLNGSDQLQCVAVATIKEESCQGHMPGMPFLPLATASWMLSQCGEILVAYEKTVRLHEAGEVPLVVEVGKVNSRYRDLLLPGSRLLLWALRESHRFTLWTVSMAAWTVDHREVLELPAVRYVTLSREEIASRIERQKQAR